MLPCYQYDFIYCYHESSSVASNPRNAWVPSDHAALGGGVNITLSLLTQKRMAVEIHARRQLKARNEKVQMSLDLFLKNVDCEAKVILKVKL